MAVQPAQVGSAPRRLGHIPTFDVNPAATPAATPAAGPPLPKDGAAAPDSFKRSAKKPAQAAALQGPKTEAGKLAETAYVGGLGVAAGGVGYFFGKTMMNFVKDIGPLTFKNVVKGQMVGGVVAGLPFSLIQDSFAYKNGEVSAKRYWGNVVSDAVGFGLWGVGAMAACALLPFGGFAGVLIGLAGGGLLNSLWDKTLGRTMSTAIAQAIPAGGAKKAADFVVKWVTNPIQKHIMEPIKRHWKVFLLTGGAAGIYFGIRGNRAKAVQEIVTSGSRKGALKMLSPEGKAVWVRTTLVKGDGGWQALKGAGAMLGSSIPQMFGDSALAKAFPMKPVAGVDIKPGEGKIFGADDGHIQDKPQDEPAAAAK